MKKNPNDLAILGGKPEFSEQLHVGRPNVGDEDAILDAVKTILGNRWLTNNGPYVREFERSVCKLLGVKHCIAMCNGTIALEIAERALGFTGEVIVPSFTFVATAHSLQWQEITPVFCDVDPVSHTLDPQKIERLLTPRTTGILCVHLWGRSCAIDELQEIADSRQIKLLFDASHAFGSTYKGKFIGNFGDAEVFSFHATKFINTFEGGAIVTNNDELAEKMLFMRNFGFSGMDQVDYIGTNGKMNEVCAAMGLVSLDSYNDFIAINKRNHAKYSKELKSCKGVKVLAYPQSELSNYQYVIIEISEEVAGLSRDALLKVLHAENVLARRYFYPGVHRMEPYRSYYPNAGMLLPVTECLCTKILCLPTGTSVSIEDIERIVSIIRLAIQNAATFGKFQDEYKALKK